MRAIPASRYRYTYLLVLGALDALDELVELVAHGLAGDRRRGGFETASEEAEAMKPFEVSTHAVTLLDEVHIGRSRQRRPSEDGHLLHRAVAPRSPRGAVCSSMIARSVGVARLKRSHRSIAMPECLCEVTFSGAEEAEQRGGPSSGSCEEMILVWQIYPSGPGPFAVGLPQPHPKRAAVARDYGTYQERMSDGDS